MRLMLVMDTAIEFIPSQNICHKFDKIIVNEGYVAVEFIPSLIIFD
jgi:CRISPR/Cas system-associated protein endoribonuclease Cas2